MKAPTIESIPVHLPAGRALWLILTRAPNGEPEHLYIAEGWAEGRTDPQHVVGPLPGMVLGNLISALQELDSR
jgi:hypothetical protein